MAKETITIDFNAQIKSLNDASSKIKLTDDQRKAYDDAIKTAKMRYDAGNKKGAGDSYASASKILTKALEQSEQLAKTEATTLNTRKEALNKELQLLKEQQSKLKNISKPEYFKQNVTDLGLQINRKDGKEFTSHTALMKAVEELGGSGFDLKRLSNDIIENSNFATKGDAKAAVKYAREYEATVNANNMQLPQVDEKIASKEQEILAIEEQIQKLPENADAAAQALTNLYNAIYKLSGDTVSGLNDERRAERATEVETSNEQEAEAAAREIDTTSKKTQSSLGKAFKQFSIYAIAIRTLRKAAREAVATIKELDKSLTEQAMVTGKTREQTQKLLKTYQDLSTQLGATTKEVASVTTEYMRQGKSTQEAIQLAEAAISSAKVAGVSTSDSVNYLTTALNGFQLSAEEAMDVSDKFAAVAANAAVSYEEIATALSKVASQANLAGMSIDYTTAILTKGIETTREAPETIGTALKTVIARMREISDYGETLSDGTDINNVESQLAYVGVELRTASGELRSTEDVLDDLGKKWDTLNTNQQAAVAKALAGTRQQSRLIAMMTDYERVTELQQISARSAGATMAQMETYLTGMEAALNKVSVAWEKIVSSLANSDFLIDLVNAFANILDQSYLMIPIATLLVGLGATHLKNTILEWSIHKQKTQEEQQENIKKLNDEHAKLALQDEASKKERVAKRQQETLDKKDLKIEKQKQVAQQEQLITLIKTNKAQAEANGDSALAAEYASQITEEESKLTTYQSEAQKAEEEYNESLRTQQKDIDAINKSKSDALILNELQTAQLFSQSSAIGSVVAGWQQAVQGLWNYIKTIPQSIAQMREQRAAARQAGQANAGNSAAVIPVIGWIIWCVIMGAGIISTVWSLIASFTSKIKTATERTSELSAEIYNLNNTKISLQNAIDEITEYDNKLIQTKEDAEALAETLDEVAESLPETADDNEDFNQEEYANLTREESKQEYLQGYLNQVEDELEAKREEQLDIYKQQAAKSSKKNKDYMEDITNIDAIQAIAVARMQQYVDANQIDNSELEALATELVGNLTISQAAKFAEKGGEAWSTFINALNGLEDIEIDGTTYKAVELLQEDTAPLAERAKIYETIVDELDKVGADVELIASFNEEYDYLNNLVKELGMDTLEYADAVGLSVDEINKLYAAGEDLVDQGLLESEKEWTDNFNDFMKGLASTNGDIASVIDDLFATQLAAFEKGTEEYEDAYNQFVNTFADLVSVGVLNMGQNLDSFTNSISVFYEKAQEWSEMSETDKTSFISDYSDMFGGEDGAELLRAFENGDYQKIEEALKENDALQEKLADRIADIDKELAIEEARVGDARNEAYIKYLKEWKEKLEDTTNLFKADLELWVEQENEQLEAYKEYLQNQQEALEDSLDERKEAYEKYFEAIDKLEDEEDYQEKADQILANLNKLGAGTDGATETKRLELTQQLEDLEEERIKELREQSRDAITEDIDDQITEINDKFDELLDNNRQLLAAMKGEMTNPTEYAQSLYNAKLASGATDLELAQYVEEWKSGTLSGYDIDWDAIKTNAETNNIAISVSETNLTTAETQTFLELVKKMMTSMGVK